MHPSHGSQTQPTRLSVDRWHEAGARIFVLLALILALLVVGLKPELAAGAESAPFQALLNPDGSGRLFTNNGSVPAWMACAPDRSSCHPFSTGGDISTAGAPADVVFWAGDNWLSPVWYGNVLPVGPPSLSGKLRANELVTPVPGSWQGGWATDRDESQLSACRDEAGTECETLTDPGYAAGCSGGATVLDPVFTGFYLRVADRRVAADAFSSFVGVTSPFRQEVWNSSPTTSVIVLGPIAPSKGSRKAKCGPPPLVRVTISSEGVAKVRCGLGCRASLKARSSRGARRTTRSLGPFPLNAPSNRVVPTLSLPAKSLTTLGPGPVSIAVLINGTPSATRTIHLH